ncbi:glycosyltransferase family 9 protein [Pedobacter alpinus]|uniref:Glycosyltransferase family 9 protein n=1 Tax=Pedobacter alpinus TaxID=1590643 RepID=A0ABW5TWS7_9SPHI
MDKKRKILIIRFSAMGDVAMTAPVVKQIVQQNPEIEFVYLSRRLFEPFFSDIVRLAFQHFDPKAYKGLSGLYRLYRHLRKLNITDVADLHFNLRSRIISFFFRLGGIKVAHLDKGRNEKKQLISKNSKILRPLKPMWMRYIEVFENLGLKAVINGIENTELEAILPQVEAITGVKGNSKWVGISPFAQHLQKIYPKEKMSEVVKALSEQNIKTFIFGGGEEERNIADEWQKKYFNCFSAIEKIKLNDELNLIAQLDAMISMDSAGMHFASLKNIPVVSVWGATHPFAGFLGFGQNGENCVQAEISCRPCSIYGNKPCFRNDIACMQLIEPKQIINKTLHLLKTHE